MTVDQPWREAGAVALETKAAAIQAWLAHTTDVEQALDHDPHVTSTLRQAAGLLRTVRNDLENEARRLRMNGHGTP